MKKIAAIQMASGAEVEANCQLAATLIQQAAEQGAIVVALPENFALMAIHEEQKFAIKEQPGEGPIQNFLREQAKQQGVWIIGGTLPLASEHSEKVRSACLVFNDRGEQVARYDKIHLFDVTVEAGTTYTESDVVEPGDQTVIVDTPVGRIGLSVCYDLRFPELYRKHFAEGAEILVVPSAFTHTTGKAHWEVLLRARAIENLSYVVAPNQAGKHEGKKPTYEHTMIVEPWGKIVDCLASGSGMVIDEIDLPRLHQLRESFPVGKHRRL